MLEILLKDVSIPFFVLWKWTEDDYKKGLSFKIGDWTSTFHFVAGTFSSGKPNDRQWPLYGNVLFSVPNPTPEFLEGLKHPRSKNAIAAAQKIHDAYRNCLQRLVSLCRWTIDLSNIIDQSEDSLERLLKGQSILGESHVSWRMGQGSFVPFAPEIPKQRGINPLFKSRNLLTASKWEKVIESGRKGVVIDDQLNELLRIKSKARWREKRIPTIETAALMEITIRNKVQLLLQRQGQSKKKIDAADDELGFSMLLNVLLPLALTKGELARYKKHIDKLDALRKVRNDIMHRNIPESSIDGTVVLRGIEAAIKITQFLEKKFS
jgi:hypothetical protein